MKRVDQRVRASLQRGRRDWYTIRAQTPSAPAEVLIYDEIGWYGVTADTFVKDLKALGGDEIVVRINSPGGDVYDGIAILNALRGHKATITTVVDGLAASAASFIAMAGDQIVMRRNSELMIHDSWGMCVGNAEDMHTMAADLDRVSNNIASIYADRAGGTTEGWRQVMRTETWYSAQEAVDAGLADRVDTPPDDDDTAGPDAKASFDLSIFTYAGRRAAPAPKALAAEASNTATDVSAAAAPPTDAVPTREGGSDVAFTDEQAGELREALSLPEDATPQDL
ncbi:head maturation protease, ClpP-related, partial [Rhodococcus jostii]